jgi:hypothetical protein
MIGAVFHKRFKRDTLNPIRKLNNFRDSSTSFYSDFYNETFIVLNQLKLILTQTINLK